MLARTTMAVCLLLAVFTVTGCTSKSGPSASASSSASAALLPRLDTSRAQQFSADMQSGDEVRLRHSVQMPARATLNTSAVAQIKALGAITFDLTTFTQTGVDTASVAGSSSKGRWKVDLVRVNHQWMIAATEPAQ
jgi:hypothetical protein